MRIRRGGQWYCLGGLRENGLCEEADGVEWIPCVGCTKIELGSQMDTTRPHNLYPIQQYSH
jgi:hypothetical protein